MEEAKHWLDSAKYLANLKGEGANMASMYYVQLSKQMSRQLQLPKQDFSPSTMCMYCGCLWSSNKSQMRLIPGKSPSKSVKSIIKSSSENNKLSRFQATLMKKSLKNQTNKIIIKCSICSKNNEIICNKPQRLKLQNKTTNTDITVSQKKKKKKSKDKTAGLKISSIDTPDIIKAKDPISNTTPSQIKVRKPKNQGMTPIQKVRKMNLNKLNLVLNDSKEQTTPKNKLNSFLKELY